MLVHCETSLVSFKFWGQAVENSLRFTYDEMETLESILEDIYGDGISDIVLNDIFAYDVEFLAECLGYVYDVENDVIVRS